MANIIRDQTTVYIEGTINDIGRISTGSGIWYAQGDMRNACLKYETDINSNSLGELLATLWVINEEPWQNKLTIKTMSSYVINAILKHIQKWEPEDFIGVVNREILQAIIVSLRNRGGPTNLTQLANDTLEIGYTTAKNLAKAGEIGRASCRERV